MNKGYVCAGCGDAITSEMFWECSCCGEAYCLECGAGRPPKKFASRYVTEYRAVHDALVSVKREVIKRINKSRGRSLNEGLKPPRRARAVHHR